MIIDGFIFYNELDLLEMRLEELGPVVDKFVVVSASRTFRGQEKPRYLNINEPRWNKWRDKIIDFEIIFPPAVNHRNNPWEREAYQRNQIGTAVQRFANADDIVMVSDVDEVPRRELVNVLPEFIDLHYPNGMQFEMSMFYYALNVRKHPDWTGLKAIPVKYLDEAQAVRHRQYPTEPDGGWHFSYLGDDDFISNKLRSFSHAELDTPLVHSNIPGNRASLLDPYNHGERLEVVTIDDTWPHAVRNNPEFWSKYVW